MRSTDSVFRRPPAALVVATLALFVALTGVSFAGIQATGASQQLSRQVAALQFKVSRLQATLAGVSRHGNLLRLSGMNVEIVNGDHRTDTTRGLGNLIIGYNARHGSQTGSHNLVIGDTLGVHVVQSLVAGIGNATTGPDDSVTSAATAASPSRRTTRSWAASITAAENNGTTIGGRAPQHRQRVGLLDLRGLQQPDRAGTGADVRVWQSGLASTRSSVATPTLPRPESGPPFSASTPQGRRPSTRSSRAATTTASSTIRTRPRVSSAARSDRSTAPTAASRSPDQTFTP